MTAYDTEYTIERHIERMMDRFDAALMSGKITLAVYDHATKALNRWAEAQYDQISRRST